MTKEEMRAGFLAGRRLIQEEWSTDDEIRFVDQLVAEGVATATPWAYRDNYQCAVRSVTGGPAPAPQTEGRTHG